MSKSFVLMIAVTLMSFGVVSASPDGDDGKPTEILVPGEGAEEIPNPTKDEKPAEKPAKDPANKAGGLPSTKEKLMPKPPSPGDLSSERKGGKKTDTFDDLFYDKDAKPAEDPVKAEESQKPKSEKRVVKGELDSEHVGKPGQKTKEAQKPKFEKRVVKGELDSEHVGKPGQETREAQKKKADQKFQGDLDSSKKKAQAAKPELKKKTHGGVPSSERVGGRPGDKTRQKKAKTDKPAGKPVDGVPVTGKEKANPPPRRDRSWKGSRSRADGKRPGVIRIRHSDGREWIIRRSERKPGRARRKRLPVQE